MRTIGFFGITIVVVGVILVVIKIRSDRSFWWLLRAQSVALALGIAIYSISQWTPSRIVTTFHGFLL